MLQLFKLTSLISFLIFQLGWILRQIHNCMIVDTSIFQHLEVTPSTLTTVVCVCVLTFGELCCDSMYCSLQAPLSMGFSGQEYQSALPCPLPGSCQPRGQTHISCISCTGRQIFYPEPHVSLQPHHNVLIQFCTFTHLRGKQHIQGKMCIFVSFLFSVEGNIFLYESVIFQSLETICSYPWYIFLLACSTFLMGWGTLFRYAVGETKDSQVLQYMKNHLEGLLFI